MTGLATTEMSHLGTKSSFNRTLRHIVSTTNIIEAVGKGANFADLISEMIGQGLIKTNQVGPLVSVINNKFSLPFFSHNLDSSMTDFGKIVEQTSVWNAFNYSIVYHQPNVGTVPINPSNPDHWGGVHDLKENELIVVYCQHKKGDLELAKAGLLSFRNLLVNDVVDENPSYSVADVAPRPKPVKQEPKTHKNLTPKYSVQVTNELFHNGNVEAWKNIIESFEATHPECEAIVYHEGELIQDLNSLFKWGKVKHGGVLFFQISGEKIKGVSRLQKYLHEGASPRYEAFMKHDVNKVLNLF